MNNQQHNLRKAAVLIDSLDPRSADTLLDHMDEPQADRVRHAVMELDDVSRDERERVMSEFLNRHGPSPSPATENTIAENTIAENDGIEIDQSLADRLARGDDEPVRQTPAPEANEAPFRFLHEADGTLIAQFLNDENPQTIAVVLAHLPPERAADALASLAADRQTEVIRRIAHLDETPPEVLQDVEAELGSRLSERLQMMRRRTVGLTAVRQIFDAAASTDRQDLLAHLAAADASLADQLTVSHADTAPAFSTRTARDTRPVAPTKPSSSSPRRPSWLQGAARSPVRPSSQKFTGGLRSSGSDTEVPGPQRGQPPAFQRPSTSTTPPRDATPPASEPAPAASVQSPNNPPRKAKPNSDLPHREPVRQADAVPKQPKIKFDDLVQVSDKALATIFAQVDVDVALLALTGADQELVQRLTRHLPARQAKQIKKQLTRPGPLRLSDIERAQAEVARLAEQLAEKNEIAWPASRERLAAAA